MLRSFKYRFYPTKSQEEVLKKTIGSCRFVYNKALYERSEAWKHKKQIGYSVQSATLTEWKNNVEFQFLRELSSVPLLHAKIADQRKDYLHKLTTRLVRENQTIVVENLNVAGLVRNKRLSGRIFDASWGELIRQLEYKCEWYGR